MFKVPSHVIRLAFFSYTSSFANTPAFKGFSCMCGQLRIPDFILSFATILPVLFLKCSNSCFQNYGKLPLSLCNIWSVQKDAVLVISQKEPRRGSFWTNCFPLAKKATSKTVLSLVREFSQNRHYSPRLSEFGTLMRRTFEIDCANVLCS